MKVKVYKAGNVSEKALDEHPFGDAVLYRTLKSAVLSYQANARQGTVKTLGRSEVAGSGKKPWKQKHTGRARAGDRMSPIWRGGGTVFGPLPRDYRFDLPARERRVALRSAIFGKLSDGELVLTDLTEMRDAAGPSSKAARKILADLGSPRRAVVVTTENSERVYRSFRNFPGIQVRPASDLCAFDVVTAGIVICEPGAFESLGKRVGLVESAKK